VTIPSSSPATMLCAEAGMASVDHPTPTKRHQAAVSRSQANILRESAARRASFAPSGRSGGDVGLNSPRSISESNSGVGGGLGSGRPGKPPAALMARRGVLYRTTSSRRSGSVDCRELVVGRTVVTASSVPRPDLSGPKPGYLKWISCPSPSAAVSLQMIPSRPRSPFHEMVAHALQSVRVPHVVWRGSHT